MGKRAVTTVLGVGLMFVGAFIPGIGAAIAKIGFYLAVTGATAMLAPKAKPIRSSQTLEYFGTVQRRRIIYGTQKVAGMNTIPPWNSGDDYGQLHQVLTICGHPVEQIGDVYFDKVLISDASIDAVTGTKNDGTVTAGKYEDRARIRRYDGTQTEADAILVANDQLGWDSNHVGYGIAYAALTFKYDEEVYKQGKPEMTFIVKGAKCYDPRLDSTPGNAPTNASYIAWTENPALCLAHYLTHEQLGFGESADRIDWDLVVAAADICDELVVTPSGYQARYTCNVVLEAAASDDERRDNIEQLASAMMGHIVYRGGQWRMYAGGPAAPAFTITADDVVGKAALKTELPSNEKWNYVRGQYVDAAREWQTSEFSPRSNSAYETEDGERKEREIALDCCDNEYEAQRNAIITLKRSRLKRSCTLQLGMSCYKLRPWDVVLIDIEALGLDQVPMRCTSWAFSQEGMIEAAFMEEDATVWADPSVSDYTVQTVASGPPPNDGFIPYPPTSMTATGITDGIVFAWQRDTRNPSVAYNLYVSDTADGFSSASVAQQVFTTGTTLTASDTTTRYYWVTSLLVMSGTESDPTPEGNGVAAAALAVTGGFRVALSHSSVNKTLYLTSAGTSITVTATPSGGTAPYTYSWARVTGGSLSITANSPSSASTTFSVTGLADLETKSATFVVTVTDSASPQVAATASVYVSFYRNDYGAS